MKHGRPHVTHPLYRLAYVEMRLILARLVFQLDMEIMDESRHWLKELKPYNLWYKAPLYVRIKAREMES
jgi:hypothetical protein